MKHFAKLILLIILSVALYIGGVLAYATITDYQPSAEERAVIRNTTQQKTIDKDTLSLTIWNIGYGGLGKESDFFHDGGTMVHMPPKVVEKNLQGIQEKINHWAHKTDLFLLQEVDTRSKRSYRKNQVVYFSEILPQFSQASAKNYDVRFIPVPWHNPMGSVNSGLSTWSKFQPSEAIRYSFEGNYSWPTYLFFLDRCFLLERFPTQNGKELVVINTHNSAYDDGSLKQRQMRQLRTVLETEYTLGNYVIVGGDWNQYPATYQGVEGFDAKMGNHNLFVTEGYPAPNWQWAYDPKSPTNRSLFAPYDADTTSRAIIDFYLLSPNIELLEVQTEDLDFEYSDHNPVHISLKLKYFEPTLTMEISENQ